MADRSSSSVYYTWIFLGLLALVILWYVVPLFSPVWLWWQVDRDPMTWAKVHDTTVEQIQKEYKGTVVYRPHGKDDPIPWQLVTSTPVYETKDIIEYDVLVRAHLLNGGTGNPPGTLMLSSTLKGRFYDITFRRFPPGSFGCNSPRPVLVYDPISMSVKAIGEGKGLERILDKVEEDHWIWPERDDGWKPASPVNAP